MMNVDIFYISITGTISKTSDLGIYPFNFCESLEGPVS